MELKEQNVLMFEKTMNLGGSSKVVLQICETLKPKVNKIVVCSLGGLNTASLDDLGIKHYNIPDISQLSIGNVFKVMRTLSKIIINENITVVHTHHRMAAFYVSVMRLYKRCTFISTSHNTFSDKRSLTRFAYKHSNIIACGEMVKKNLVEVFGLPEGQVTVIPNAVKPFEQEVTEDPLISKLHEEGCFVIGNVGRLSEQKGMEYYIQAIPEVISHCPNTRFLIVGAGVDEEKLKQLASELKIQKYLSFMGYRNDIQNLMTQMDLVVLSSLWEGLPLTPIEAYSVGKAVVATAVDGTLEIVKHENNGLVVPCRNSKLLATEIVRFASDNELRKNLEKNARDTYCSMFSYDVFRRRHIEYYQSLKDCRECKK